MMQAEAKMTHGPQLVEPQRFNRLDERAEIFVILVSYNTAGLLNRCIDSLRAASQGLRVSVVIVDNASRDGSAALIKRYFTDCTVIENKVNVGFGRANNHALTLCNAPFVLLLNTDAFMADDALQKSLSHMAAQTRCGVLGVRLVNEAGNGNASVRDFPTPWRNFAIQTGLDRRQPDDAARAHGSNVVDCDWVTGCFYLVRRAVIDEVGLFDPRYFMYFEEVDHCRAAQQAGWKVQCLMNCTVIHVGGASAKADGELTKSGNQLPSVQIESELLYFRKHDGLPGLATTLMLGLATDVVLSIKDLLRGRGLQRLRGHARHTRELCRLAVATRGGLRPTR
jgi:N-acetylglucosaminyl-diphospho-decaprenol L-rhamnosyltransferase